MQDGEDAADGGDGVDEPADEGLVRAHASRPAVEEWLLVLTAEGFRASMHHTPGGFCVRVPAPERAAARRALEQWDSENVARPKSEPVPPEPILEVDRFSAGVVSLAMVAFFLWTGPRSPSVVWFERGGADASAILGGELWRTVTALCLHADAGHVASNALFGAIFLAAAAAGFGPGVAIALTLASGAFGNLANALFQGPGHASVGASTAVFGTVGLLAGRALASRLRRGEIGVRAWVPLAAGLALIAMIGTSERSDVWAHGFGFLTGAFLGIPASLAWPRRPGWAVQLGALAASIATLGWAWRLALA